MQWIVAIWALSTLVNPPEIVDHPGTFDILFNIMLCDTTYLACRLG